MFENLKRLLCDDRSRKLITSISRVLFGGGTISTRETTGLRSQHASVDLRKCLFIRRELWSADPSRHNNNNNIASKFYPVPMCIL